MIPASRPQRPGRDLRETSPRAIELARGTAPATGQALDLSAAVSEEEFWLAGQKSARTRKAYRDDVHHFIRTVGLRSGDDLRNVDRGTVLPWLRALARARDRGAKPSTIRQRSAAVSSL